ncbi:ion channel [Pleionea mediterranea]|uniref:Ion channel n=1 Tax=Pleionea mediterranea TaxID=523701 RepID=A0A316FWC5_9GAMM|nr:ion channel [Pleionea mediterranea]PWK52991.1 ion channel [Pleionea mediterranea]
MSKFQDKIETFVHWSRQFRPFSVLYSWIAVNEKNESCFLIIFNLLVISIYFTAYWTPWIFIALTIILPVFLFRTVPLIGPVFHFAAMARKGEVTFQTFVITIFVMVINHICVFASLYMALGVVVDADKTPIEGLWHHFYFSVITYTTLGYGNLVPGNLGAEIVSTIEAILGFATFAFLVGLVASLPMKKQSDGTK